MTPRRRGRKKNPGTWNSGRPVGMSKALWTSLSATLAARAMKKNKAPAKPRGLRISRLDPTQKAVRAMIDEIIGFENAKRELADYVSQLENVHAKIPPVLSVTIPVKGGRKYYRVTYDRRTEEYAIHPARDPASDLLSE